MKRIIRGWVNQGIIMIFFTKPFQADGMHIVGAKVFHNDPCLEPVFRQLHASYLTTFLIHRRTTIYRMVFIRMAHYRIGRSGESRGGEEWFSTCRSRWSPDN